MLSSKLSRSSFAAITFWENSTSSAPWFDLDFFAVDLLLVSVFRAELFGVPWICFSDLSWLLNCFTVFLRSAISYFCLLIVAWYFSVNLDSREAVLSSICLSTVSASHPFKSSKSTFLLFFSPAKVGNTIASSFESLELTLDSNKSNFCFNSLKLP